MFQAASATSRVQAKNGIITQGIEIMSLMCKVYESVTSTTELSGKKVRVDCVFWSKEFGASTTSHGREDDKLAS